VPVFSLSVSLLSSKHTIDVMYARMYACVASAGDVHGAGDEPERPALRRRACTGGGEEVPD